MGRVTRVTNAKRDDNNALYEDITRELMTDHRTVRRTEFNANDPDVMAKLCGPNILSFYVDPAFFADSLLKGSYRTVAVHSHWQRGCQA